MFRRRRRERELAEQEVDAAAEADLLDDEDWDDESDAADGPDGARGASPAQGPWDAEEAPDDEVPRLDLGALRIPAYDGMEVRVDVSPEGAVVAATVVQGPNTMQLSAFAAPRSEGIWADVRAEIATSLQSGAGAAEETEGPFGTELRARIPAEAPGQRPVAQPARFVGVDGPRWFLRALIVGPGATDAAQATELERLFREIVVVRGKEAMAARDPLPLRLPREVTETATAAPDEDDPPDEPSAERGSGSRRRDGLGPLERGPEITETR